MPTEVAPAAPAASSPAPAAPSSAPAAAPSSAPATPAAVTPAAAAAPTFGGGSGVKSSVDPGQFRTTDEYAKAVLAEQLAAGTAPVEEVAPVAEPEVAPAEVTPEVAAPDAVAEEAKPAETPVTEEDFQLEPETIVTPELLTSMVKDVPEFGKLLEANPALKGQLYKTAREAAELQPYREIFPDLESAKSAVQRATTFNDLENVFETAVTMEGTKTALARIMELSYERDENGNVVMQDGKPVAGEYFYKFFDHVKQMGYEQDRDEVQERFDANQYHVGAKTQEEAQAAYDADAHTLALLDKLMGQVVESPAEMEQLPPHLQRKAAELAEREKALNERQQGEKVEDRAKFEKEMQGEANKRIADSVSKILTNVEKQGGVISPYLKDVLSKSIPYKTIQKIAANPALQEQMSALQRLPMNSAARDRRIAALDRAYQMYLPDVAREELRAAGVQIANGSKAKLDKINGQAALTQKTEPKGSTGPAGMTSGPLSTEKAFEVAEAEWRKANPGKRFDTVARNSTIGRAVQLQLQ
jgi:hypothetical protein